MSFTVTRQSRWPDGEQIVEISFGGIDYSGPDMLVEEYKGELQTFLLLSDAVENAIRIADQWQKDCPEKKIKLALNFAADLIPSEDLLDLSNETRRLLREEAVKQDAKLPHCDECGKVFGEEDKVELTDFPDFQFCSDKCAERFCWKNLIDDEE